MSPLNTIHKAFTADSKIKDVYDSLKENTRAGSVSSASVDTPVITLKDVFHYKVRLSTPEIVAITISNILFFAICFVLLLYLERRRYKKQLEKKKQVLDDLKPKVFRFVDMVSKGMTEDEKVNLVVNIMSNEMMKYNWNFSDKFDYSNFNTDTMDIENLIQRYQARELRHTSFRVSAIEV